MDTPTLIGPYPLDDYEDITYAVAYDLVYPLTPCCQASATGTEDGIACRACYHLIDHIFGMCWTTEDWNAEYPDRAIA